MIRIAVVSVDMGFGACLNSSVTRVYDYPTDNFSERGSLGALLGAGEEE